MHAILWVKAYLPDSTRGVWCIEADGRPAGCVGVSYMGQQPGGGYDRGWVYYWADASVRGLGVTQRCVRAVCD